MQTAQAIRLNDNAPAHATAILAIICTSYFMVILDNSIIFTGLPSIARAMHFSVSGLTWVQDAYTLLFGGLLLLAARAGDIVGRRTMFAFGLALFGLSSFLVGAAVTPSMLIGARALQGVGAAILAPSSLSLLTASFPEGVHRSRAVAAYSAVAGIGASLGLVVGGILADLISWRAGFFLNVPLGAVLLLVVRRYVPETPRRPSTFDITGAIGGTLGTGALVFAVISSAGAGWVSPVTLGSLLLGAVVLAGFVWNESRAEQPIMPLRLFNSRERVGAYLVRMLYLGAMIGFFFFTTQYLQGVLGYSPLQAGLAFLPMSAVNFAVALLVSRLVRHLGPGKIVIAGVALTLAGMAWLAQIGAHSSYLIHLALPMVLLGAGQGLAFAPMTSSGLVGVDPADAGAASGVVNTAHQLGSALGLGILTTAAASVATHGLSPTQVLVSRVTMALTVGSLLLALALLLAIVLIGLAPLRTPVEVSGGLGGR